MFRLKQVLFFCIAIYSSVLNAQLAHLKSTDYFNNKVIVKVKQPYREICTLTEIDTILFTQFYNLIEGKNLAKKFPYVKRPVQEVSLVKNKTTNVSSSPVPLVDITLIYEFEFSENHSLKKVIRRLELMELFEYVEPHYIPKLCYVPNDSAIASQYTISRIQADLAWDVNVTSARGDTNVVIGITDTGFDFDHPDLKGQVKYNYGDVIDGFDNDGDGYIDNFSGWNF